MTFKQHRSSIRREGSVRRDTITFAVHFYCNEVAYDAENYGDEHNFFRNYISSGPRTNHSCPCEGERGFAIHMTSPSVLIAPVEARGGNYNK